MSSLNDRRQSILGRRRTADPASKRKRIRAPRSPRPSLEPQRSKPGDLLAEFRAFPRNTRLHAEFWLANGYLHPNAHSVIRERLTSWVTHVEAEDGELRAALLAETRPADPALSNFSPVPVLRPSISAASKGVIRPETSSPVSLPREGPEDPISEVDPSNSVIPLFAQANQAETLVSYAPGWEVPADPAEVRKRRRGHPSVFEADWWGEAPTGLPRFPKPPSVPLTPAKWNKWGRELAASIRARTAPALLPLDAALAALDFKRKPRWLPSAQQDGEEWVEREPVRAGLLFGLPQAEIIEVLAACPIRVPRCRYCGRLSHYGSADRICDRCDATRTKIGAGTMSRFSITERRGWTGPPTIGDDELLLAIQRRLRDADQRIAESNEKAARQAARDARRAMFE